MKNNKELQIAYMLKNLGISANLCGYRYLKYAIGLVMEDASLINRITKDLYPRVAQHFDTTPSRVERGCRHAIEVGWLKGNVEIENKLFGYSVSVNPTNGTFIATVADYLCMVEV